MSGGMDNGHDGPYGFSRGYVPEAQERIASLSAENERLRAALQPFAAYARALRPERSDGEWMLGGGELPPLCIGDFRRARAALSPTAGREVVVPRVKVERLVELLTYYTRNVASVSADEARQLLSELRALRSSPPSTDVERAQSLSDEMCWALSRESLARLTREFQAVREDGYAALLRWLKDRPGASWEATIKDVEQAIATIRQRSTP